jgi:hypothetical protein
MFTYIFIIYLYEIKKKFAHSCYFVTLHYKKSLNKICILVKVLLSYVMGSTIKSR